MNAVPAIQQGTPEQQCDKTEHSRSSRFSLLGDFVQLNHRFYIIYGRTGAHFELIVPQSEESAVSPPILPGLLHKEQAMHILH